MKVFEPGDGECLSCMWPVGSFSSGSSRGGCGPRLGLSGAQAPKHSHRPLFCRAFTLVEMMIVVVVLVTLMTMVFKLSSIGDDSSRKNTTVVRLQRLENCLSGYYAAFGSYPPVRLHAKRNPFMEVDPNSGVQLDTEDPSGDLKWAQVKAVCLAQPIACNFPYPEDFEGMVESVWSSLGKIAADREGGFENIWGRWDSGQKKYVDDSEKIAKYSANVSIGKDVGLLNYNDKTDWKDVQVFRFGLMSYLLPRYLVMMGGYKEFYSNDFKQWSDNNMVPHDPLKGGKMTWDEVRKYGGNDTESGDEPSASDYAKVANIPSQAVCARWMPNLEGMCSCNRDFTLFGIDIRSGGGGEIRVANVDIPTYTPGPASDTYKTSNQYVLDSITVKDGWNNDIYYYSPAPYQKYTLWSGGPDGKTFPPWIARDSLTKDENKKTVASWTADDIIHLSN